MRQAEEGEGEMRLFGLAWFGLETFSTESSGRWADLSKAKRVQRPGLLESMVLGAARLYKLQFCSWVSSGVG